MSDDEWYPKNWSGETLLKTNPEIQSSTGVTMDKKPFPNRSRGRSSNQFFKPEENKQERRKTDSNWSKNNENNDRRSTKWTENSSDRRRWSEPDWKRPSTGWNRSKFCFEDDPEFKKYEEQYDRQEGKTAFLVVKEISKNLFEMPKEYCLGHCVAEDMNMGSGIAVEFRRRFGSVAELLNQHARTGDLATLTLENRFIFYLVTKQYSNGKPTYASLYSSLKKLRSRMREHKLVKLALPRIGCGLDRLEWDKVKFMLEFVFRDDEKVEIIICNLDQMDTSPQRHRNCKVTHVTTPIEEIEKHTIILYFATSDGVVIGDVHMLDQKIPFLRDFKTAKKSKGDVIFYYKNSAYLICGCIVKENVDDDVDFVALIRCLKTIEKENREYDLIYYAFKAMKDFRDKLLNHKIINVLRNFLNGREVYVCYPPELEMLMPPKDRNSTDWNRGTSFGKINTSAGSSLGDNSKCFDSWSNDGNKETDGDSHNNEKDSLEDNSTNFVPPADNFTEEKAKSESSASESEDEETFEVFSSKSKEKKIKCTNIIEKKVCDFDKKISTVSYAKPDLEMQGGGPPNSDLRKGIGGLLRQKRNEGDIIRFENGEHYIYIIILNQEPFKTQPSKIFSSIKKLKKHAKKNAIRKLYISNYYQKDVCFDWSIITEMYQFLLGGNTEMVMTSFTPVWDFASIVKRHKNKITHSKMGLHQLKENTIIVFLCTANKFLSDEILGLDRKFRFVGAYQKHQHTLGENFFYEQGNYLLCGCVIKEDQGVSIDFGLLQKCLDSVNNFNKSKNLRNVAIQAVCEDDVNVNFKIVTILLYCLENVSITICWPVKQHAQMPKNQ